MTDTAHRDIFASRFRALAKRDGATKTKLRSWFETNRFDGLEDFLDRADATGLKIADAFLSGLESPGLHTEPERDHFKSESPIRAFTDWSVNGLYAIGKGFRPSLAHLPSYLNAMERKEGWRTVQVLEAATQTPSFLFYCVRQISDDELRARHPALTVDLDNPYKELADQLELEAMDTLAEMQQAVLKVATGLRQVTADIQEMQHQHQYAINPLAVSILTSLDNTVDRINGYAAELAPAERKIGMSPVLGMPYTKPSRPEKEDSFGAIYGRDYLVIDEDGDTVPAFYEGDTWWLTPAEEGGAKVQTPRKIVSIKGPLLGERPSATGRKTLGEYIEAYKQGIVLDGFGHPANPSLRFAESDKPKLDACAGAIDPDKEREAIRIAERDGIRPKPIPELVYWSDEHSNFYGQVSRRGQGQAFFNAWYPRRAEFPTSPADEGAGDLTLAGQEPLTLGEGFIVDPPYDFTRPDAPEHEPKADDPVNPKHYAGRACADIGERMTANSYQILKYNWRLGEKDSPCVELGKAIWYLDSELSLHASGGVSFPGSAFPRDQWIHEKLDGQDDYVCDVAWHLVHWNREGDLCHLRALRSLIGIKLTSYQGCPEFGRQQEP